MINHRSLSEKKINHRWVDPAISQTLRARWIKESDFNDLVEETWQQVGSNPNLLSVHAKLNRMHDMFHDWDQRVLKKPKKRLRKAQRDLEKIITGPMNDETEEKRNELSELIEFLLELEEIHYMQRSRSNWLQLGDRNTDFFQAYASAWRKKNYIKKLNDGDGNSVEGTTPLSQHIHNYFSNLFSLEVQQVDPEIMQEVQTKVTNQMNDFLIHHIRMMMFARPCLVLVI
uniref:Uncharacterized protein n=2 Tax=Aegilops tauschii subsp. strangulata TaxID=200361 RepID=A0A452ZC68_AEGTS